MGKNRKGEESGQAAAVLILVIGLFIVLYILLLPPEQRQELLQGQNETSASKFVSKTILSESPGLVKPAIESTTKHEITSLNLFMKSKPEIDLLADRLAVRKTWFNSYFPKIKFDVNDLNKLQKANLYFRVVGSEGTLRIWINGNEFYSEKITETNLKIVDIPTNYLSSKNEIKFGVDTPLAFWNANEYSLGEVSLKKEYNLVHQTESRTFSLSSDEKSIVTSAELSYFMYCNELQSDSTTLKILLNKRELFSGVIKCVGTRQNVDIDKSLLRSGVNDLSFEIGAGDFLFSEVFVKTDYKSINYPLYYFTLSEDDFTYIQNGDADASVEMKLSGGGEKDARILINDKSITMKTSGDSFTRNINDLIENGDNFIKIIPSNSFTIDSLKIVLK